MKKETFEQAVDLKENLDSISNSLNQLVAQSENSKLHVMRIFSILDKDGNSRELQLNFKGNELQDYKFLPEKIKDQVEILSQTYRETIISLLKRAKGQLENDFALLEDLM